MMSEENQAMLREREYSYEGDLVDAIRRKGNERKKASERIYIVLGIIDRVLSFVVLSF
jgi:hypothetical protein